MLIICTREAVGMCCSEKLFLSGQKENWLGANLTCSPGTRDKLIILMDRTAFGCWLLGFFNLEHVYCNLRIPLLKFVFYHGLCKKERIVKVKLGHTHYFFLFYFFYLSWGNCRHVLYSDTFCNRPDWNLAGPLSLLVPLGPGTRWLSHYLELPKNVNCQAALI